MPDRAVRGLQAGGNNAVYPTGLDAQPSKVSGAVQQRYRWEDSSGAQLVPAGFLPLAPG